MLPAQNIILLLTLVTGDFHYWLLLLADVILGKLRVIILFKRWRDGHFKLTVVGISILNFLVRISFFQSAHIPHNIENIVICLLVLLIWTPILIRVTKIWKPVVFTIFRTPILFHYQVVLFIKIEFILYYFFLYFFISNVLYFFIKLNNYLITN